MHPWQEEGWSAGTTLLTERKGKTIGPLADSDWLYVVPWGLKKLLAYVHDRHVCFFASLCVIVMLGKGSLLNPKKAYRPPVFLLTLSSNSLLIQFASLHTICRASLKLYSLSASFTFQALQVTPVLQVWAAGCLHNRERVRRAE